MAQKHVHKILLVEGGPDYLAACQLIGEQDENVLPVAMLGGAWPFAKMPCPTLRAGG